MLRCGNISSFRVKPTRKDPRKGSVRVASRESRSKAYFGPAEKARVRPARAQSRANLNTTRGLIMSAAVMMALGAHIGRQYAHDLVYAICRDVVATGRPLVCSQKMRR